MVQDQNMAAKMVNTDASTMTMELMVAKFLWNELLTNLPIKS